MEIHRIEVVPPNRTVLLEDLPFDEGQTVNITVTVVDDKKTAAAAEPYPFRGMQPYRYDDPFSPLIPPEDWEPSGW